MNRRKGTQKSRNEWPPQPTYEATEQRPSGLEVGTRVHVKSEHFVEECNAVITEAEYSEGWLYRIDVTSGDCMDAHRETSGELWVCDFEVQPVD